MNTRIITLLCGIVGMFLFTGCAEISMCGRYFRYGGVTTIAIRDSVRYSKEVDEGLFSKPEEAFLTTRGDVYVKTTGKLASDDANMVYILEIPAQKRAKFVTKFYHKNKHVSGVHTVRLSRNKMHKNPAVWERARKKLKKEVPIYVITDRKELMDMPMKDQIVFREPSLFAYGQEALIDGEPARWVWFNAAPESYSKGWLKVFIPFTYLFDVITSPIQIPILIDINKRT